MKSWPDFTAILPCTNDLYRIYQPLLRWKSRIFGNRFDKFRSALYPNLAEQERSSQPASLQRNSLKYRRYNEQEQERSSQPAPLQLQVDRVTGAELTADTEHQALSIGELQPVAIVSAVQPHLAPMIDCGIARLLQRDIGGNLPRDWSGLITSESMTTLLERLKTIVANPNELQNFPDIADYVQRFIHESGSTDQTLIMQTLFDKEARVASFLLFLSRHKPTQLDDLFITAPAADNPPAA